jgi:hypothetical protein
MSMSVTACAAARLLLARAEGILKPYGITFAAYEALRLLAFTRTGDLGPAGE